MSLLLSKHTTRRKLEQLVENRTAYCVNNAELNVFETHVQAHQVSLRFDSLILASMITGKKVMHLPNTPSFEFFPGESVIVPGDEEVTIDFPEASADNPTQCLALVIDPDKINKTVALFNDKTYAKGHCGGQEWRLDDHNFHLLNDRAIDQLIRRLIFLFTEDHSAKDVFVDLLLQELIIRLLQSKARNLLIKSSSELAATDRLATVVQFIKDHLSEDLTVDMLSREACMSKPHFFRCFKNTFGMTPVEFVNDQRIRLAKTLLADPGKSLADVSYEVGINNSSYFIRLFKRHEHQTPSQYRRAILQGR